MTWTLYNADCIAAMQAMPDKSFDLVLTDPPYGLGIGYDSFDDTEENVRALAKLWLPEARRIAKRVAFTCGVDKMFLYDRPDWVYNWYTPQGSNRSSFGFMTWQPIMYYGKDAKLAVGGGCYADTITWSAKTEKDGRFHPCPKPIEFFKRCLMRFANEGDRIFDPFTGSGSCAIACMELGFEFTGTELSEEYCKQTRLRLEQRMAQQSLILPTQKQQTEQGTLL